MLWPPTEIFPAPVSAPEPALYAMAGRVAAGRGRRAQRRLALRRRLLRA
jgi:hypothetical protein